MLKNSIPPFTRIYTQSFKTEFMTLEFYGILFEKA